MKHNIGFNVIEPGANPQVVPKEADKGPPEGFIDNTVRVYKMVDGEKVLVRTEDPFSPGWDTPQRKLSGFGRKQEEDNIMAKYDWDILWPQVLELRRLGKNVKEVAAELEMDLTALKSKIYREEKAKGKQTPNPEPEKVGRQEPAQGKEESAKNIIPEPVKMPVGCALPKDDSFTVADDEPIPYQVNDCVYSQIDLILEYMTAGARLKVEKVLKDPIAIALIKELLNRGVA